MTIEEVRFCQSGGRVGLPHELGYNGKANQSYTCRNCAVLISKRELKGKTDA